MDTTTVMQIIKMIDVKHKQVKDKLKTIPQYNQDETQYWQGMGTGLQELSDHLQEYIEAEVSAIENNLG
jgi:uncharacterized protein YsxB (DUF464 family)